jgi:hypothetical protein
MNDSSDFGRDLRVKLGTYDRMGPRYTMIPDPGRRITDWCDRLFCPSVWTKMFCNILLAMIMTSFTIAFVHECTVQGIQWQTRYYTFKWIFMILKLNIVHTPLFPSLPNNPVSKIQSHVYVAKILDLNYMILGVLNLRFKPPSGVDHHNEAVSVCCHLFFYWTNIQ